LPQQQIRQSRQRTWCGPPLVLATAHFNILHMKRFSKKKSEDVSTADFEIADSDDEAGGEEVEDDEPGYKVHDEPDQVAFDAPVKYTSVKKGAIRIRSEMESDKVCAARLLVYNRVIRVPCFGPAGRGEDGGEGGAGASREAGRLRDAVAPLACDTVTARLRFRVTLRKVRPLR
jgi:hypothetical protein